ncbi:MAG: leucyl aminopeptidase, partial [Acidimicrobiia bacterium]|nr:leucyl aminopeptidase [Acidimicrobiia bacterium]
TEPKPSVTESLTLARADEAATAEIARGSAIAAGTTLARDLVNEPPIGKPPVEMARIAESLIAEGSPLQVKVYDENESLEERFGGLLGVAAGATNPPRMVVFDYQPDDAVGFVAFVGKGIVFDSGGLSLKPPAAMETMKTDMSGAAAVFGAIRAIAELGLPVRVMGIAPITENMPSGSATRPGDVLTIRNGKTIEVLNTDAEGRLVLADGLSLAAEAEPDLIVDVATLTGACAVALGPRVGGLFANDDEAAARVEAAAKRAGEDVWRLPMPAEYRKLIDSPIADMKNTGGRYGGAITAALLLKEFVGEIPWAHLDIAGPARSSDAENYVTKGGTGFGVRTLVEIAASFAE